MMLYRGKYRVASARAAWWDYGNEAVYFVTICTHERAHFFGEIHEGQMRHTSIGQIANRTWLAIPHQFSYARLAAHVVMPNHVHGLLAIDKTKTDSQSVLTEKSSSKWDGGCTGTHNPMIHENLSRILRWYKGRSTFEGRKIHADFAWQSRFHDHIVRSESAYRIIEDYILHNAERWREDKFYS